MGEALMLDPYVHHVTRGAIVADAVIARRVGYRQSRDTVQRHGATSTGATSAIAGTTTWPGGVLGS